MALVRRVVQVAAAALGLAVYVWFTAVRNVGRVKRRKASRRRRRNASSHFPDAGARRR